MSYGFFFSHLIRGNLGRHKRINAFICKILFSFVSCPSLTISTNIFPHPSPHRAAEKAKADAKAIAESEDDDANADDDAEDGTKKKKKKKAGGGGIQMPEEWPWEEAKKVFEHPDVLRAEEVEVRCFVSFFGF